MQTKLTVRVEQRWLEAAKNYAASHGTTLSKLISDYLEALSGADSHQEQPPILRRLSGILPADVRVEEHRQHLAEKHGG